MTRFLLVEDVARRYGVSVRWVHERTRKDLIPVRVLPHSRRLLFELPALQEYEAGCELERVDLPHGGRLVRPKLNGAASR